MPKRTTLPGPKPMSHTLSCLRGSVQSTLGCGTSQCCDTTTGECVPNIYGPCVCFDYNGPTGRNFTFMANCLSGGQINEMKGVSFCSSNPAAANGYDSCYCRLAVDGFDVGGFGVALEGNWILNHTSEGKQECLALNSQEMGHIQISKASNSHGVRYHSVGGDEIMWGFLALMLMLKAMF